ncbi:MAG: N-acetyl sugar amidotransferase [Clostridiales bacterium]|nr:N-acetyl sugar amidotransferase [Clostridiales bacterium]
MDKDYQICTNCVMDTTDPQIKFDENGRCDFCDNFYNSILPSWHPDEIGERQLNEIANKIKKDGRGKKYDCIIGLSGGVDSSYLAYITKVKLGLRPLMLSVDTGWNLNVANENVSNLIKKLDLDLITIQVEWEEMKDLQLAFLKSQVPYQDTPQDHAIFAGLYNYAAKHGIKYVLTGGNYSTEGVKPPQEWTYLNDIRLIKDIHKRYGSISLKTFPLCGMFKYKIYYRYFKGLRVVRPLNMIPYEKENAIKTLETEFGWKAYENKHYENIFTRFYEGYWLPKKFGYDKRRCYFSSEILSGQMGRDEALKLLNQNPYDEKIALEDMEYITKRLGIDKTEFVDLMKGENKTFRDYRNSEKILKLAVKLAMLVGIEKRNFR